MKSLFNIFQKMSKIPATPVVWIWKCFMKLSATSKIILFFTLGFCLPIIGFKINGWSDQVWVSLTAVVFMIMTSMLNSNLHRDRLKTMSMVLLGAGVFFFITSFTMAWYCYSACLLGLVLWYCWHPILRDKVFGKPYHMATDAERNTNYWFVLVPLFVGLLFYLVNVQGPKIEKEKAEELRVWQAKPYYTVIKKEPYMHNGNSYYLLQLKGSPDGFVIVNINSNTVPIEDGLYEIKYELYPNAPVREYTEEISIRRLK